MEDKRILSSEIVQRINEYIGMCSLEELCMIHNRIFPVSEAISEDLVDDDTPCF